jgi:tetraacyldisaccharide 4'-kinase
MRTAPRFWGTPPGLAAGLLAPAAAAWDLAGRLRRGLARPYYPQIPVVCVGNLVAGGAGKTPVALAIAGHLSRQGVAVHLLTRGYGGRLSGPVQVEPAVHDTAAVGDEALLLAEAAPCWVARDRAAGARAAAAAGAEVLVLDDGLQNPGLAKSLSLVVVDGEYGFGNGRVMPAGPLREPVEAGLARADAIVLFGPAQRFGTLPTLEAELLSCDGERFAGQRVFAFAGIARPQKFFAMLQGLGASVVGRRGFPDHHRFRPGEIAALRDAARRSEAQLVTTKKDIVRLRPDERRGIEVLEVEVLWRDPACLAALLAPIVERAFAGASQASR